MAASRLIVLAAALPLSAAADLTGYVTLASDYVYRGMAMADGNPALQGGLDLRYDNGFFAGVWGTTVDLAKAGRRRDAELDYYVGWRVGEKDRLTATLTALRYTYPRSAGEHRYDYTEFLLAVSPVRGLTAEYGHTADLFGLGGNGRHWRIDADRPLSGIVVGAGIGRNDLDGIDVPAYLHWNVGASARIDRLTVDLRWYDNERGSDERLRALSAGDRLILSLTASFP